MMNYSFLTALMDHPHHYRIVAGGVLSPRWADHFSGLELQPQQDTTILSGELQDQAALLGTLQQLFYLSLPILEVKLTDYPTFLGDTKNE